MCNNKLKEQVREILDKSSMAIESIRVMSNSIFIYSNSCDWTELERLTNILGSIEGVDKDLIAIRII